MRAYLWTDNKDVFFLNNVVRLFRVTISLFQMNLQLQNTTHHANRYLLKPLSSQRSELWWKGRHLGIGIYVKRTFPLFQPKKSFRMWNLNSAALVQVLPPTAFSFSHSTTNFILSAWGLFPEVLVASLANCVQFKMRSTGLMFPRANFN